MGPGGRIRPHRLIADLNNTTINERMRGWGLERPGDGVATSFIEGDFDGLGSESEIEVRWAHKPRSSTKNKQNKFPELNSPFLNKNSG